MEEQYIPLSAAIVAVAVLLDRILPHVLKYKQRTDQKTFEVLSEELHAFIEQHREINTTCIKLLYKIEETLIMLKHHDKLLADILTELKNRDSP